MVELSAKTVYQVQPSLAPRRKLWHREKVKSADVSGKKNLVRADIGLFHKLKWRRGKQRLLLPLISVESLDLGSSCTPNIPT